ncbi:MAG: type II toxin-antitoxin system VapC family toxin [Rubrobacteraceae bacterium]
MDTSVWIDYMRDIENEVTGRFDEIQERGLPFGITALIHQEVLQGAASPAKFDYLVDFMNTQDFYHPEDPVESYKEAARIYFDCRRAGVTIRSAIDCLIARIAIENDLFLLHNDRDFEYMAEIEPELKLA